MKSSLITPEVSGLHPLIDDLAACIRYHWNHFPEITALTIDHELEAISGNLDGEALFIRNELYHCRGFRKLHLETARLGVGLHILHCVFFPDPYFDLPIFGTDIVASPAGISAAIFDLSPTSTQLSDSVVNYIKGFPSFQYQQPRVLPTWGKIFSPIARFIRPMNLVEESKFLDEVNQFLLTINSGIKQLSPFPSNSIHTINRHQIQLFYCMQQKRNDKTRRVLEKAFNTIWADKYINELLFDNPPALFCPKLENFGTLKVNGN
uniref:Phycocyanobilin:ferredoxin oxidoreductase n=1 Tax=Paulinella chromatophora TaxID=39717 RepID=B1X435_PAUCH|nr:phycocyanobilin:ferredoxin oxidoreductase [Paulinella chromatophora]ACB42704.1 phycocyanobilin:ferredoxin oxidoreductase [Paulinella chromatophora]